MKRLEGWWKELARLREMDWIAVVCIIAVFLAGLAAIYSATAARTSGALHFVLRQALWGILSAAVFVVAFGAGYERFLKWALPLFAVTVGMLVLVLAMGYASRGAQSWFDLGPFRLQPSELGKVTLAIALAAWVRRYPPTGLGNFTGALLLSGFAGALVALQPDLGSAAVYACMTFVALVVAGAKRSYILALAGVVLLCLPLGWSFLKEYQKLRLLVFLNPSLDPLGAGYNVIQSRIAVGAGGLWGKGFLQGSQSRLHFLPEPHTDFIFSVFSEEFGFLGSSVVLLLFAVLLWRIIGTAMRSRDRGARVLVTALSAWIWFQVFECVAMSIGLAPVTGIPLPLMSYGGSSLISLGMAFGLVQSVYVSTHRQYK